MVTTAPRDGAGATPAPSLLHAAAEPRRVLVIEASWCIECKRQAPTLEAVAAAHPSIPLERIDVAQNPDAVKDLAVRGTPTIIGFTDGAEVGRLVGRSDTSQIEALFASLESGTTPTSIVSVTDATLRLASGMALSGIGLVAGPAWPLVVSGAGIVVYGLAALRRQR